MSENQDKRNVAGRLPPAGADVGPVPSPGVPVSQRAADVGRAPSHGGPQPAPNAASGDAAYNKPRAANVGPVPSPGVPVSPRAADVGRVPSHGGPQPAPNAASGDAAYNKPRATNVDPVPSTGVPVSPRGVDASRVPSHGVPAPVTADPPHRRLRRLHRVWPDRDGNISYLLTPCVDGRIRVLDNEDTFQRLVSFLLDSPARYRWFGRRFVVMPAHVHLIAHMGQDAFRLGQWMKALKAVVGGLKPREERPVRAPGLQDGTLRAVGRVPPHGVPAPPHGAHVGPVPSPGGPMPPHGVSAPPHGDHEFTRIKRSWRWQDGFHDHKFRTPESESRKWEYVCLNPVRYGLVKRPEEWPFSGEIFYEEAGGPRLVRGTPPLLETGMLIEEDDGVTTPRMHGETPGKGTRPTT